ncbi:hypothetical protein [Photobacterium sanguinicancri]|uniref:Uncharacterized protein n=1 Tax=Photobacterium sanguinicancri TaxID=875932 RepID=A0AAW7Y809_9GAMM|nr:hypothetical protein [Photobacterium sanguinicancri]MDO6543433.1 hypothetical protein [Photobacterium sanguinicancri]
MKRSMLSFLALAITTSLSAGATAASLDVHGDIKVNGKTVIDSAGNLVQNKTNTINIADYQPSGDAIINLKLMVDGELQTYKIVYAAGKQVSEEAATNGAVSWKMTWGDRTESAMTVTTVNGDCIDVVRNEFELSNAYAPVDLGHTTSRIDKFISTFASSTCKPELVDTKEHKTDIYLMTPLVKYDFKYGENKTVKDCILVNYSINGGAAYKTRTLCKGIGLVEFGSYSNEAIRYHLTSVE